MPNQSLSQEAIQQECPSRQSKVWYLVFTPNVSIPWWQKALILFDDDMFGHVSIVGPCGDSTIFLDPRPHCIDINYVDEPIPVKDLIDMRYPKNVTVRYQHKPESSKHISNMLPTCVSFVKSVMGYKGHVYRPYALFKQVIKRGGELV